jgi:hypothetical protein
VGYWPRLTSEGSPPLLGWALDDAWYLAFERVDGLQGLLRRSMRVVSQALTNVSRVRRICGIGRSSRVLLALLS